MQARMHEIKTIHFKHRRSYKYILDRKFYVNIGVNSCNVSRLVHILNPTSLSEDIHLSLCKWPLAYAAMIMWCTCEINARSSQMNDSLILTLGNGTVRFCSLR